jgi:signal transduction histidine kinase
MAASTVGVDRSPDPNEGAPLASLRSTAGADSTQARLATASSDHDHLVALYDTDASLVDSVVAFLAPALAAGEPMIVLATDQHREQIRTALISARGDRSQDVEPPGLVMLDAAETLDRIMVDGAPDAERFRAVIGGAVEAATAGQRGLRIFGEMVAILWEDGDIPGAIAVEDLWNDLLEGHHFGLLCGYPSSAFDRPEDTPAFHTVCSKHLAVIPSESSASAGFPQQVGPDLRRDAPPGDREQQLMAEIDRLQERDQLRSRFVAMVAHEVRHPTAVLIALLDLLETSWPELDAGEIGDYLHKALSNAHQMDRLTRDILTLSRLEGGEFSYQLDPVDLGEVAARAVDEVSRATGRSIVLALESGLPAARADADRQRQILQNLLSNAVKFSPDGSAVFVDVDADPEMLTVSVRDGGAGILVGDRDELFRAFSRPGASGRSTRGAGLGLYITKALVEGQGGTIDVRSVPGDGSTFTYTVPTADA